MTDVSYHFPGKAQEIITFQRKPTAAENSDQSTNQRTELCNQFTSDLVLLCCCMKLGERPLLKSYFSSNSNSYLFILSMELEIENTLTHVDSGAVSDNRSLLVWFRLPGHWPPRTVLAQTTHRHSNACLGYFYSCNTHLMYL